MLGVGIGILANASPPGTLPDGTEPTIFADFVNAIYTKDGAPTTIDDILAEDTDNFGSWAGVTAGVGVTGAPAFTGAVLARMVVGATFVIEYESHALGDALTIDMFDAPDWNESAGTGAEIAGNLSTVSVHAYTNNGASVTGSIDVSAIGTHKMAVTLTSTKIAISADGSAAQVVDPADPWSVALDTAGPFMYRTCVLKTFGIYPVQDDADLTTLSAL